jgi:hypothetical protein
METPRCPAGHLCREPVSLHGGRRPAVVQLRCPQTVYSEIFMWIERRIEGSGLEAVEVPEKSVFLVRER